MQRHLMIALMLVLGLTSACGRNGSVAPAIPLPNTQRAYSPAYNDATQASLPEGKTPKKLAISPATVTLPIGSSVQLTGTVSMNTGETVSGFTGVNYTLPGNNDQGPVIQKRDSQAGVFLGQREGNVTVTGTVGDLTATATIQVVKGSNLWQQTKSGTNNDLRAVKMINDQEGWAVGMAGTVLHYMNGTWVQAPVRSSGPNLKGIDFGDVNEGWAVGDSSILRFVNGTWQDVGVPTAGSLNAIDMISLTDGWIVGENGGKGVVLRYQGGTWQDAGAGIKDPLNSVSAIAPNDVWAVGDSGLARAPAIYHYDGSSWSKARFGKWPNVKVWAGSYSLKGIRMLNGSQGYAVGSYAPLGSFLRGERGVMFKYDQNLNSWQEVALKTDDDKFKYVTYNAVGMMGVNRGWVLGNVSKRPLSTAPVTEVYGNLFDSDGNSVTPSSSYQANQVGSGFYGIDVLFNGNGAIVGDKGMILMHLYDVNRPTQASNTGGFQGSYNSNYNNAGGGYYGSTGGSYDPYGSTYGAGSAYGSAYGSSGSAYGSTGAYGAQTGYTAGYGGASTYSGQAGYDPNDPNRRY